MIGRADDVLNVAGHRIGTAEVESALVSHHCVAEAAVIGVPDPIKGECIKAFVLLRAGQNATDELNAQLAIRTRSPRTRADRYTFGDSIRASLPKTRSGKIMRRYPKAQETGQEIGDISTLEQ